MRWSILTILAAGLSLGTPAAADAPGDVPVPPAPEARRLRADDFRTEAPQLAIAGVSFDPGTRRLTIIGERFGSHRLPSVKLDGEDLPLTSFDDSVLVTDPLASVPTPGQHLVTVVAGNDRTRFDVFKLVIGKSAGESDSARSRAMRPNSVAVLDRVGDVGWDTAIVIGADGKPLVLYLDYTHRDLKLARCKDGACAAFELMGIDTKGDVGWSTSIEIAPDGRPTMSYFDNTERDLKVARCLDPECRSVEARAVDREGEVGQHTSLAFGRDGLPVIGYYDKAKGDLKVAHCEDSGCAEATISVVDRAGNVGLYTAIAIGSDGNPVVSYFDVPPGGTSRSRCARTRPAPLPKSASSTPAAWAWVPTL